MKLKFLTAILALLLCLAQGQSARAAATLLPNGEQCFQATTGVNGMVGTLGTITGGSGGTAGTYGGVSLTGGSGSGATANITVSGGAVTAVTILNPGSQYVVGDTLSAASGNIGSVSGFSIPIASVSINSSLAGGTVGFYYPSTNIFKQTWFNSDQDATHQNANPVTLDANGCAIIYGTGSYRQLLKDSLGNTIWDQVTTDTSANNNTFWAGTATGTPNVIALTDTGFNATDGSIVNFTALFTNTGSTTINPSSFGAIPAMKDTTAGPVALTGGEIVATNPVSVIFRASDNAFHLLNTVISSPSGSTAPLCGASGFRASTSANINIAVTATQAVMQSIAGLVINRSSVSFTINISTGTATSTANGMDGEAIPASSALYVWLIDNGSAPAGLVSTSATAPTMPSGYTYKCRIGSVVTDGSSHLYGTLQLGPIVEYVGSDSAKLLTSGSAGASCQTSSPTYSTVAYTNNGPYIPSTATEARLVATNGYNGGTFATMTAAPNNSYQGYSGIHPAPISIASTNGNTAFAQWVIESANIYYCSSASGGAMFVMGWKDAVNAN